MLAFVALSYVRPEIARFASIDPWGRVELGTSDFDGNHTSSSDFKVRDYSCMFFVRASKTELDYISSFII